MPFLQEYRPHRFNGSARKTVDQALLIVEEMQTSGYTLTLRQLYYQFVGRGLMENNEKQYKRLGRLVTHAREAGEMDWFAIEDRGRQCNQRYDEEDPAAVLEDIEFQLSLNMWYRQDNYLEVWVEKQALEAVVSRPCEALHVTHMACKGYLSASESWRAGMRFRHALNNGKKCTLVHLADHDPSGLNMTEDNADRLRMFAEEQGIEVRRIALNMDQVEQYNPPPNPAKETDSRAKGYVKKFGPHSWELDALTPGTIEQLITDTIEEYRDKDVWNKTLEEQDEKRRTSGLVALSEHWDKVFEFLTDEELI